MDTAALSRDNFMPQPLPGRGAGLVMALVAHGLLVLALTLGVSWRASPPTALQAELWAEVPRAAAPAAVEPSRAPPPLPMVKAPEPRQPPRASAETSDAQIATEKARREKAIEEEQRQREIAQKKAKDEAEKTAEKLAAQKAVKDKELAAQRKAQEEKQKEQQEFERTAAAREAQLKRIQGLAGGSGVPTSTGNAAQSAGPSATYMGRVATRIKSNIVFAETLSNNPLAEIEIRVAPDGRIISQKLVRSSGVKAWDDAVQRAVERTEMLPRDVDGRVPSSMQLLLRPQD